MDEEDISLEISSESVSARLDVSSASPRTRFYVCIFFAAFALLLMCLLLFAPGKHGTPSMWNDLLSSQANTSDFLVPLAILLIVPVMMVLLLRRYIVEAYPSDETFHCDRSTLTISKVKWFDIRNKQWTTLQFPLADVADIRYRSLASAKNTCIYGLRFRAGGRTQRVLPGLTVSDAAKILNALKGLGADVPDDPSFKEKLDEETTSLFSS